MLNHTANEELRSAKYVNNFLDVIENLPDEVQRQISTMRELDIRYQGLLDEMDNLREELETYDNSESVNVKRLLAQLQEKLITSQELADEKLSCVQTIVDLIEGKQQQLDLDSKDLECDTENEQSRAEPPSASSRALDRDRDSERPSKRPRRAPRIASTFNFNSGGGNSTPTSSTTTTNNNSSGTSHQHHTTTHAAGSGSGGTGTASSVSASSGTGGNGTTATAAFSSSSSGGGGGSAVAAVGGVNGGTGGSSAASLSVSSASAGNTSSSSSTATGSSSNSSHHESSSHNDKSLTQKASSSKNSNQKKTTKKKKRKARVERERDDSPPEMPIDPDEPTYCLCEQVSYGEMIGCDNDLCPIEWFHFSCVNLTHKPKGKWFCPKCRGDKPTLMKPRAQFLRELEKYNKEKEEKS